MGRWTGEVMLMQVGCNWAYKLRLQEQAGDPKSELVLGRGVFPTEEAAREAGAEQLQSELGRRSSEEAR
jgi:hypothetical protein